MATSRLDTFLKTPPTIAYGLASFMDSHYSETHKVGLLRCAITADILLYDTAAAYESGENERRIATVAKDLSANVLIATKVGIEFNSTGFVANNKPEYLSKEIAGSLSRLGGSIDILFLHRIDPSVPIKDTIAFLKKEFLDTGLVKKLGLCTQDVSLIRAAHAVYPISFIQEEYSLWSRDVEFNGVLAVCKELDISFMAYQPLARGALSNKTLAEIRDPHANPFIFIEPRYSEENLPYNLAHRDALLPILAEELNCTTSQLALAWLLAKGKQTGIAIIPIPSTMHEERLKENIKALSIELNPEIVTKLDSHFSLGVVKGERQASDAAISELFAELHSSAAGATKPTARLASVLLETPLAVKEHASATSPT